MNRSLLDFHSDPGRVLHPCSALVIDARHEW
jgi:hypothetical protein